MRLQFIHVDDVADHRGHQREQPAEAECHQGGRQQQQPGDLGVVAHPLQGVAEHGDPGRHEEGPPLADLGAKPGDEHDDDEGGHRTDRPRVARILGAHVGVATEDVVDDHVELERRDQHEAVEDEEGRGAELQEWRKLQRQQEAAEEVGHVAHQCAALEGLCVGRILPVFSDDEGLCLEPLAQEQGGQDADGPHEHGDDDRERSRAARHVLEPVLVLHDPQEPRRHDIGELADEVLHAHQAGAFMVIRRELVAERDPGRGIDGVGEIEDQRAAEEVPEVERLALVRGQLPQECVDDGDADGANEDVRPAAAPAGARVVRYVAHQRIGQRVRQTGECADQPDQRRVHAEAEVEHDDHPADGRGEQVVDERTESVDQLLAKRNAIFRRGRVMRGVAHVLVCPAVEFPPARILRHIDSAVKPCG